MLLLVVILFIIVSSFDRDLKLWTGKGITVRNDTRLQHGLKANAQSF